MDYETIIFNTPPTICRRLLEFRKSLKANKHCYSTCSIGVLLLQMDSPEALSGADTDSYQCAKYPPICFYRWLLLQAAWHLAALLETAPLKATGQLSKSNINNTRLDITPLKVKQILFLLYIITEQTCWINLITTVKSALNAATSRGF